MLENEYPIGTMIKWTLNERFANDLAKKDIGKTGKIVGYDEKGNIFIFLPGSTHFSTNSTPSLPISWWASWKDVKVLVPKKQQLLFDFMNVE